MKLGTAILIGGGLLALSYSATLKRVRPQLTLRTIRVRLGKISLQGNRFRIAIIISNPTSDNIVVRSVVGEVYLNGKKIGTVESFERTDIAPNAKTTIYLELRLLALQVYDTILDFVNNDKINIDLGMTGTINVNDRPWPVHLSYDVV